MSEETSPNPDPETPNGSSLNGAANNCSTDSNSSSDRNSVDSEMIGQFPPEIAALLVIAGVAGVILPGPFGTPLLIAGGAVLWPKTFKPIEKWFSRKFPAAHREGVKQIKRFVSDLNRRFPENGK